MCSQRPTSTSATHADLTLDDDDDDDADDGLSRSQTSQEPHQSQDHPTGPHCSDGSDDDADLPDIHSSKLIGPTCSNPESFQARKCGVPSRHCCEVRDAEIKKSLKPESASSTPTRHDRYLQAPAFSELRSRWVLPADMLLLPSPFGALFVGLRQDPLHQRPAASASRRLIPVTTSGTKHPLSDEDANKT